MTYKFIKILAILFLSAILNIAWFWGSAEDSEKERLRNIDDAVSQSRTLLFEDKTAEAIELLQNAYSKHGENKSLCESLAYAYSQAGEYASSAIYFEKAFNLSENNTLLLINAGRAYEQCNAMASALSVYERYAKLNPKDAPIWKSMAKLLEKEKNYQASLNAYMQYLKNLGKAPNTTEACEIARLFLKLNNLKQSKAWFSSALEACGVDNVEIKLNVLTGLVDIALAESDMPSLEKNFANLNALDSNLAREKYPELQAKINAYNAKLDEAKKAIEIAENLEEQEAIAQAKKLEEEELLAEAKKKEEAEKIAKKAKEELAQKLLEETKIEQESAEKVKESAAIRAALDPEYTENVEVETQAEAIPTLELTPTIEESTATQETPEENVAEASEEITPTEIGESEQEIEDEVVEEKSLMEQCEALLAAGKYSSAENIAHDIISQDINNAQSWAMLAKVYYAQGMSIDAYLTAKQALAKSPKDIGLVLLKLQTSASVESPKALLLNLIEANKTFPECEEIVLGLARVYAFFGNIQNSKHFYEMFMAVTPERHPLYEIARDEYSIFQYGKAPRLNIENIAADLKH